MTLKVSFIFLWYVIVGQLLYKLYFLQENIIIVVFVFLPLNKVHKLAGTTNF